ncbi:MAG: MFS transporter, partial [Solirubrobacteraceae bacterium]|nr:MFS transporter [Solirubrobacteraceae bacterium]
MTAASTTNTAATAAAGGVLATLATGQFLMALDSSVMNVSIAQVAADVGTNVTGVQSAITAYTLVMAILMIPGGKVGSIIGHKRAFMLGCIIYGAGSFTTAISQSLTVLLFGWAFLEGVGAALILPAIVALVAGNFPRERRAAVYGMIAAAAAIAVAAGPLIGGAATTYASWRLVFAGEVVLVLLILVLARRVGDAPAAGRTKIDIFGGVLSAVGLGTFVFGVLRSGTWGWVVPKPGAPDWLGLAPTPWLLCIGLLALWAFLHWEDRVIASGGEPLVNVTVLASPQLRAGLTGFFFQFLIQMGLFFLLPLYLSIALGLTAMETGVRVLPLSITLFAAA